MLDNRIYAIVNSACADAAVNAEALRVMQLYCQRTEMVWRFGTAIGAGLVVVKLRKLPLANRALRRAGRLIREDLLRGGVGAHDDVSIRPAIPKALMDFMRDSPWSKRLMAM